MEMLNNAELSDIASWRTDGEALIIYDKQKFTAEVMPVYFKGMAKFTSFTRRMNRWKFTLQPFSSKSKSVYFNPLFMRDDVQLCLQMRPKPQKSTFSTLAKQKKVTHHHRVETEECPSSTTVLLQNPSISRASPVTATFLDKGENYNYEDSLFNQDNFFYHAPYSGSHTSLSDLSLDLSLRAPSADQEARHSSLFRKDQSYQNYYQASLLDAYAEHQSQLAREIEASRFAFAKTLAAANLFRL